MVWAVVITERSGKDLADYQVRVEVTDPDFFSECTEQKYVEFYDSDKTTLLSHYTELFDAANNKAVFWVKVPSIPASSTRTIYLNVNTERTEDLSNGEAVFDFFDDFEGGEFDTAKWENVVDATIENGQAKIGDSANDYDGIVSKQIMSKNMIAEAKMRITNSVTGGFIGMIITDGLNPDLSDASVWVLHGMDWQDETEVGVLISKGGTFYDRQRYNGDPRSIEHIYKTVILDDWRIKWECEGSSLTSTETIPSGTYRIMFREYDANQYVYVDFVRVRKYTEPEPSVTVAKVGATATLDFKRIVAKALAGKISHILNGDPRLKLYSGGSLVKEITAGAKLRKEDTANKRYIVMFLFVDDSSDAYTTDSQELIFPHPDGDYVAFTQSESFEKVADEPLPLRWEIYVPWTVDDFGWG